MVKYTRDDFEKFHDYGCLIPNRIIYFGSSCYDDDACGETGVDFHSAAMIMKNLIFLDKQDKKPITIHFNSPGGDWDRGIAIHDCILGLRSPVQMVGYGCVRSMGTVIMQACEKRYLTPNCRFMVHDGTLGVYGTSVDVQRNAKEGQWSCDRMHEIYLEKMIKKDKTMTIKKISKMCEHDKYFSGHEAVKIGLADKVLG